MTYARGRSISYPDRNPDNPSRSSAGASQESGIRAERGGRIVHALSTQLLEEFGKGFSEKSLWYMTQFAGTFSNEKIVSALRRDLS
ncbi:MAG: DUF1016 N-terminal domain-containing protein [Candidatus Eisenbacteria bacterium]|nr:DUF1016 N-terminal domain-containing protein [Candidatus Eisenbacteria bacterium]